MDSILVPCSLYFWVPEFDSLVLHPGIPLKLLFLYIKLTSVLYINIVIILILKLPLLITASVNLFLLRCRTFLLSFPISPYIMYSSLFCPCSLFLHRTLFLLSVSASIYLKPFFQNLFPSNLIVWLESSFLHMGHIPYLLFLLIPFSLMSPVIHHIFLLASPHNFPYTFPSCTLNCYIMLAILSLSHTQTHIHTHRSIHILPFYVNKYFTSYYPNVLNVIAPYIPLC
jgi:hypothetical protein